jgi:hypothetical protein
VLVGAPVPGQVTGAPIADAPAPWERSTPPTIPHPVVAAPSTGPAPAAAPQPTLGVPAQPTLGGYPAPIPLAPVTPATSGDATASVNVVPLHPPFGIGSIVGLIGAVGVIIGGVTNWWPHVSAQHLPVMPLIDMHSTTANPKLGIVLIAIGALGVLASLVPMGRVWRFPLGLAAIALPFLYLHEIDELLSKAHSKQSVTDLAQAGVWITLIAGFVLAASVRMHKRSMQTGRIFMLVATALVLGVTTYAFIANHPASGQAAFGVTTSSGPAACKLVPQAAAATVLGADPEHPSGATNVKQLCAWELPIGSGKSRGTADLDVMVRRGNVIATPAQAKALHATTVPGVGSEAYLISSRVAGDEDADLVFLRDGITVDLSYSAPLAIPGHAVNVKATESHLIALARSVATQL